MPCAHAEGARGGAADPTPHLPARPRPSRHTSRRCTRSSKTARRRAHRRGRRVWARLRQVLASRAAAPGARSRRSRTRRAPTRASARRRAGFTFATPPRSARGSLGSPSCATVSAAFPTRRAAADDTPAILQEHRAKVRAPRCARCARARERERDRERQRERESAPYIRGGGDAPARAKTPACTRARRPLRSSPPRSYPARRTPAHRSGPARWCTRSTAAPTSSGASSRSTACARGDQRLLAENGGQPEVAASVARPVAHRDGRAGATASPPPQRTCERGQALDRKKWTEGVPVKGRNEPAHLVQVAEALAGARGDAVPRSLPRPPRAMRTSSSFPTSRDERRARRALARSLASARVRARARAVRAVQTHEIHAPISTPLIASRARAPPGRPKRASLGWQPHAARRARTQHP